MTNDTKDNHVLPLSVYLTVGTALLTLTVVTVWVASYNLGPANLVVAMLVAALKGTLVAMYFMHLRYDNKLYSLVFGGALFFLAVFIIITMFDTLRRDDIYDFRAEPAEKQAVIYSPDQSQSANDTIVSEEVVAPKEVLGAPEAGQ